MSTKFTKVQSSGNDFVAVRAGEFDGEPGAFALRVCERRFGIGADGLLVLDPTAEPFGLRMFNADGTEDFCGNGLACAAMLAVRWGVRAGRFPIRHGGRDVWTSAQGDEVGVELPAASFRPEDVPLARTEELLDEVVHVGGAELRLSAVSTGSTHAVTFVDGLPGEDDFQRLSPLVETHALFPERASLMWVRETAPGEFDMRIWERGVGETLGCGTGSMAAAVVAFRRRGSGGSVRVRTKGGQVVVTAESWASPLHFRARPKLVYEGCAP